MDKVELRQHPPLSRYTLMAAFYIQRSQEITDSLIEILTTIIKRIDNKASFCPLISSQHLQTFILTILNKLRPEGRYGTPESDWIKAKK